MSVCVYVRVYVYVTCIRAFIHLHDQSPLLGQRVLAVKRADGVAYGKRELGRSRRFCACVWVQV